MRSLGWWMGCLVMGSAACSVLARDEQAGGSNVAGRGNDAGESGVTGGAGGALDGVPAGMGGTVGDECDGTPKDLDEYCSRFECPETPDDVDLRDCDARLESSCGGVSVIKDSIFGGVSYHFDADGHLVGLLDSYGVSDCPVGRQCAPQGPATDLCHLARCDAVDLQSWCSASDSCSDFDSPEAIQQLCAAGDKVERFTSSCAGAVYRSGARSSEWSFDDTGKLLGVVVTKGEPERCFSGGYSKVAVYGEPCEAVGEGVDQCGAGGQGMAGDECSGGLPKDLGEYCSRFNCPETPDDVNLRSCTNYDENATVTRRESSCGGVSVTSDSIYGELTRHFDADGHLIGIFNARGLTDCQVGRQCTPQGPATNLCEFARCDGGTLQYWCNRTGRCSDFDSPESIQQLCSGGHKVERFTSSCDGAVFRHGSREWSFDGTGKLLGVVATMVDPGSCSDVGYSKVLVYGEPCEAVGEGVDQCGAGGEGGASGSGAAP